jgi:hypothetical protein
MYRKKNDELTEREVEGELVILQGSTGDIHKLNQVAACMWKELDQHFTPDRLVKRVTEQYAIDSKKARQDVDQFLNDMMALNLVEKI